MKSAKTKDSDKPPKGKYSNHLFAFKEKNIVVNTSNLRARKRNHRVLMVH